MRKTAPPTNIYFIVTPCTGCAGRGGGHIIYIARMTKRGTPPKKTLTKRENTKFCRRRGFRRTCGRWHHSNGPEGCMRFHGTLLFIYSPSLSPNSRTPNGCGTNVQALSSPKRQMSWYFVRTGNISAHRDRVFHPRRAS